MQNNYLLKLAYIGKKFADLYYSIYFSLFLHLILSQFFSEYSYMFMAKTFRMLLKRHIVCRAIWLLSREITLEKGLLVTSSFPGRTLRSSFLSCLSASSSRLLFSLTTTASFHGVEHLRTESRGAKIYEAKMPARKLT